MGIGRFLTDSILQKEAKTPIARTMASRFPGFYVLGYDKSVAKTNCGLLDIYIDGTKTSRLSPDVTDLSLLTGEDVAGVEFYTQASPPVQYRLSTIMPQLRFAI